MEDEKLIRQRTLEELDKDFDYDLEKFFKSLKERISISDYFNDKYSLSFKPFPVEFFKRQLVILNNLTENEIKCYKIEKNLKEKPNIMNNYVDIINKSPHYNTGKYECIDVMKNVFGDERLKIWCILNAFKYLYRCYYKNGDEDLEKATYYLNYINKYLIKDKEKN